MLHKTTDIVYTDNIDALTEDTFQRQDSICMVVCSAGRMQISFDDRVCTLEPNQIFITLPTKLVGHFMRTPDFRGTCLTVGRSYAREVLMDCFRTEGNWWGLLREIERNPVLSLNEKNMELLGCYFNLLCIYLESEQTTYRRHTYRLLARAASCEILAMLNDKIEHDQSAAAAPSSGEQTFRAFLELLHHDDGTHRVVGWYAEQLHRTPKYLSHVIKACSGHTASEIIDEWTIGRIKHYMANTDLTVKEISAAMGFPGVSYFSKYVRRHMGDRPMAIRRSLRS